MCDCPSGEDRALPIRFTAGEVVFLPLPPFADILVDWEDSGNEEVSQLDDPNSEATNATVQAKDRGKGGRREREKEMTETTTFQRPGELFC